MGWYTDGSEGVLDEAGGKKHNNIEATPAELKLGEVGKLMRAGYRQGGGDGGCSSGVV